MNPPPEPRGITFHWEVFRRFPTVLPGFILVSLLAHAATFFVFRVVYPAQATMAAPPPEVTVLDPRRPDHLALLRWIEAEDPAPAMSATSPVTERLLQVEYKPSYATLRTPPLMLPEEKPQVRYPPAHDPLSIIRSVENRPAMPPPPPPGDPTRVTFAGPLQPRAAGLEAPLPMKAKSAAELQPAVFLVGVDARGVVQYLVPQVSSGDTSVDQEVSQHLSALKLAPGTEAITWGRAIVEWGADAYRTPETAPSP